MMQYALHIITGALVISDSAYRDADNRMCVLYVGDLSDW